jgi:hypothetical protein
MQPADSPRRGKHSHQVWRQNLEWLIFGEFFNIPEMVCPKRVSVEHGKFKSLYLRNG